MTPAEYCQNKAAPAGSALHYSTLFLPPLQRQGIFALHALRLELAESVGKRFEPAVPQARIDWWQEELSRLAAGSPQHPVSHALTDAFAAKTIPQEQLDKLIAAARMDLDYDAYPGFTELSLYAHRSSATLYMLVADILGATRSETLDFAVDLGLAMQFFDLLLVKVREHARNGRIYIPMDELHRFGVAPEKLRGDSTNTAIRELFAFQAKRVKSYYRRALQRLPAEERSTLCSQIALAEIRLRQLDEIERDGFRLLEHSIRLTPLRKLWISWRTQWRESGK